VQLGYSIDDIKGINPLFCMLQIHFDDGHKYYRQSKRRFNHNMQEVVKKKVAKLLEVGIIYPTFNGEWVSPVQIVPKKGGMIIIRNECDELISIRNITWHMCIDYR